MKPYILPYKMGSKSAKTLAQGLGTQLLKLDGSNFNHTSDKLVINWGNSTPHPRVNGNLMLNNYEAIKLASNKLHFFKEFEGHPIVKTPIYYTRHVHAQQAIDLDGHTLYARTILTGHSGNGIIIVKPGEQAPEAPLYTVKFPTKHEYRIHVVRGSVIDITMKRRRRETEVNEDVRNYDGGWIFARNDIVAPPNQALEVAIRGVTDLGLDFGACDILVSGSGQVVLCEINTAPGIEGTTLEKYINAFKGLL